MSFRFLIFLLALAWAVPLRAQDVRLLEFLTTNTTGITDEDGTAQPWIELWNPSTTTKVTLTSWTVSNGAVTWTFPAVEIMPDEQMIVWASAKNRVEPTAPLHTSFTLPVGGGTLTLKRADGTVASQIASYPAQTANVSYGRDEWDTATIPTLVGFYKEPTPGSRNNFTGAGVAGKVLLSVESKAFTSAFSVALTQATPVAGAVIRYTLDGSVPTATSTAYTAPLTVGATQLVRARVFKPGLLPGETETRGYLLLDASTSAFSSTMPLVVISNFGQGQPPDLTDQASFTWVWEPAASDGQARFTNLPTLTSRTVVDRRGSSTLNNAKYNINLETRKARSDDDRDVSLLGMADGSDYVFSGPFEYDRSDLHNPLMYAMSRQVGRYAPDVRLAEVFMDVTGGALTYSGSTTGDYFGIYNVMEKIRRDPNRINIHKLDTYDNDAVGKTGGYIFKVDRLDNGDSGFSAGGQAMAYYYPKELELKSPQRLPQAQFLSAYITSFNNALQSSNWKSPTLGYAPYLDVPAAIDHHLLNIWALNVDGLRLSGYWHKERGGKLVPGTVWDFDRALSSTDGRDANPLTWRSQSGDQGTDFFNYTWWNRLFQDVDFYQKYIDRWQELRRGQFSPATINTLIDSLNAQMSAAAVDRDVARWGKSKRSWTSPFTSTSYAAGQPAEVQRLKDWLQQRANFFDSQWVGAVNTSVAAGNVPAGTPVVLTGPSGATIYYTLDGSDPRPSGGDAPTANNVYLYSGPLTVSSTMRLRARAYNASWATNSAVVIGSNNPPLRSTWGGLTSARYATDVLASAANVVISEINYHPTNPTAGELSSNPVLSDSDFEFLELHNIGNVPVDLGGMQFTAGVTFNFVGDNALTLPAGGYVMVTSNPGAFAKRYGNLSPVVGPWTGNLDNKGEQLVLKSASGSTIFDLTYDDAWYPTTDGSGSSLIIVNELAAAAAFSTKENWRASALAGGSPGMRDTADVTPPVIAGPFTPLAIATGVAGVASLPDYRLVANASDNVGVTSLTQTPAPQGTYPVGTVQVTITASDANNNRTTSMFEVAVLDGTPPSLTGTFAPGTVSTGPAGTALVPDYVSVAQTSDNVGVTSVIQSPVVGTAVSVGSTTVTVQALDLAGNKTSKEITLLVLDATPPDLTGTLAPLTLSTGLAGTVNLPNFLSQVTATDNVGVTLLTQNPSANTPVGVGTTTVTLVAQDAVGNSRNLSADITVTDGTPPVIQGTFAPLSLRTGDNGKAVIPDFAVQADATDNVDVTILTQDPLPGTQVAAGAATVTLTAQDAAGNVTNLPLNLTISDGTSPMVSGPFSPLTLSTGANGSASVPDYTAQAVKSDNVGVVSIIQSPVAGAPVSIGDVLVELTARDAAGNLGSASLHLTVTDGTPPVLTAPVGGFSPKTLLMEGAHTAAVPDFTNQAVAADNVAVMQVTQSPAPGSLLGAGPVSITLTAQDAAGQTATLSFVLRVIQGAVASRDAVPGVPGATYVTFGIPAISDAGGVAYTAKWSIAGGRGAGIISGDPATLLIAAGEPVPGIIGATFKTFSDPVLNSEGKIAFVATIQGPGTAGKNSVLMTNALPGGNLQVVAQKGRNVGTVDGAIINSFRNISLQGEELLYVAKVKGANNLAAYRVTADLVAQPVVRLGQTWRVSAIKGFKLLDVVSGSPGQERAHVAGSATFLVLLKDNTQVVLDSATSGVAALATSGTGTGSQAIPDSIFHSFGPVAANAHASAMTATMTAGPGLVHKLNDQAVFLSTSHGYEPVAREGQMAPGAGGVAFRVLRDPVLAPFTEAVAFPAVLTGPAAQQNSLWWRPAGGELQLVAREGGRPPGTPAGTLWKSFPSLAISGYGGGSPLFLATLTRGSGGVKATNDLGLWALGKDGQLHLIAREGDTVHGQPLRGIGILTAVPGSTGVSRSFNNSGQVIYRATFRDHSQAIITAVLP